MYFMYIKSCCFMITFTFSAAYREKEVSWAGVVSNSCPLAHSTQHTDISSVNKGKRTVKALVGSVTCINSYNANQTYCIIN